MCGGGGGGVKECSSRIGQTLLLAHATLFSLYAMHRNGYRKKRYVHV